MSRPRTSAGQPLPSPGRPKNSTRSLIILAGLGLAGAALSWGLNKVPRQPPALAHIPIVNDPVAPANAETVPEPLVAPNAVPKTGHKVGWPPPAGTPREKLFGEHTGEAIQPVNRDSIGLPCRRRFCDPWYRLSNARWATKNGEDVINVDVEVVSPPKRRQTIDTWIYIRNSQARVSYDPFEAGIFEKSGTVTFRSLPFEFERIRKNAEVASGRVGIELFLISYDAEYHLERTWKSPATRRSGALDFKTFSTVAFKVSPSIFLGPPGQPHLPRDWTPEETVALTGPPGRISITIPVE